MFIIEMDREKNGDTQYEYILIIIVIVVIFIARAQFAVYTVFIGIRVTFASWCPLNVSILTFFQNIKNEQKKKKREENRKKK